MPIVTLTDLGIRALGPGLYFDAKTPSFGIRVGKNRKTWIVLKGENRTKVRIGHYPALSLQDARRKALVTLGSPFQPPDAAGFTSVREELLEKHGVAPRPRSLYQIKRTLNLYFNWQKPIDKITHNDVVSVLGGIKMPSERAHAMKDIKTFFT